MGVLLPNIDHIIAMYVRKEALLSSQIEGTQASLEDIFDYESNASITNVQDVEEVVNYIKAMNHGLEPIKEFPMSIRLIKEIHKIYVYLIHGAEKRLPGNLKRFSELDTRLLPVGSTLKNASFIPPPPETSLEDIFKT